MYVCTFDILTFSFDCHGSCILIVIGLIFACFRYFAVNVCMYVWSVYDVANLMSIFFHVHTVKSTYICCKWWKYGHRAATIEGEFKSGLLQGHGKKNRKHST